MTAKAFAVFFTLSATAFYCFPAVEPEPEISADKTELRRTDNMLIYTGNVKLVYGNNLMTADRITLNEKDNTITAAGNIRILYSTLGNETAQLSAESATYNKYEKKTYLSGKSYFLYKSTAYPEINISSDKIMIDEMSKTAYFDDNVSILTFEQRDNNKTNARSRHATYDYINRNFLLKGDGAEKPFIEYSNEFDIKFEADEITILSNERKFIFIKGVNGTIETSKP